MANPFSKGWKHLMASFDQKIDEKADPKVQIKQAVETAKKRHHGVSFGDYWQPASAGITTEPTVEVAGRPADAGTSCAAAS